MVWLQGPAPVQGEAEPAVAPGLAWAAAWVQVPALLGLGLAAVPPAGVALVVVAACSRPTHRGCDRCEQGGWSVLQFGCN